MPEINLLQKESQDAGRFHLRRPGKFSLYFVLGLLIFELLIYGILALSQRRVDRQMLALDKRSADVDLEVNKIDDKRQQATAIQSRLKNLDVLLDSHLFWSQVFSELESRSYKPIQFESLQVDNTNHRFVLTGTAASQADLAKFMLGLKTSSFILNVNLRTSIAQQKETKGYLFNMELTFDPKLLRK